MVSLECSSSANFASTASRMERIQSKTDAMWGMFSYIFNCKIFFAIVPVLKKIPEFS